MKTFDASLSPGAPLRGGWKVDRLNADGSARFSRPAAVDRRKAFARFAVAAGCISVGATLADASLNSADNLWALTWSLVVLFVVTGLLGLTAVITDIRRSLLGVFLEVDLPHDQVRGVLDGAGWGQFRVSVIECALASVHLSLKPFEESRERAGLLLVQTSDDVRLLAPEVPNVDAFRSLLEAWHAHILRMSKTRGNPQPP